MRTLDLYIDGRKVDLADQSLILMNYTMSDMSNPTIVKNSYSQQITIPGTPGNEDIFGQMQRDDRITGSGGGLSGVDFSPIRRTPFAIVDELGQTLESGYCRLDTIERRRSGRTYKISLFSGLGDLFYSLTYKSDGSKKTLADLVWQFGTADPVTAEDSPLYINKTTLAYAWQQLTLADDGTFWHQFNFAPAYNGLPGCKFDANKAVYHDGGGLNIHPNLYVSKTEGGQTYTPKSGVGGDILLEMTNKHTEWEMQDLRTYLQRPVVSLKWLLKTIARPENTGGWTLQFDPGWIFSNANPWYELGWITLPMFDRDNLDPEDCTLADILKGTSTPADYLIGFAKMMGCVFVTDHHNKTITMMGRNNTYADTDIVDIEPLMDIDSDVNAVALDAKWLDFQVPMVGQFADEYAKKYERAYGSQWVDTGTDFDAEAVTLPESVFRGAADVLESNGLYQVFGGDADGLTGAFQNYLYKIPFFEDVTWRLFRTNLAGEVVELECKSDNTYSSNAPMRYSMDGSNYNDFLPKVQLHGDDDKAVDGSNILLFFDGMVTLPTYIEGGNVIEEVVFHISEDSAEMLSLNNGVPCWEMGVAGSNILDISSLPSFRRCRYNGDGGAMSESWDFGDPREIAVEETLEPGCGLYANFWELYIGDRYDKDVRIVTCKVDLRGFSVGDSLLRRFYSFGSALWVMNAIRNWSLTTEDPAECEFVKVKDMDNYRYSQIY